MRNTIIYDLNDFNLCISILNNQTNAISIITLKEDFENPYIKFTLRDGSIVNTADLEISDNQIEYEVPSEYYDAAGNITFQIIDNGYSSSVINMVCTDLTEGDSLTVESETDTSLYTIASSQAGGSEFTDEWKTIINANTAARHEHNNKLILDGLDSPLTNEELEALLT